MSGIWSRLNGLLYKMKYQAQLCHVLESACHSDPCKISKSSERQAQRMPQLAVCEDAIILIPAKFLLPFPSLLPLLPLFPDQHIPLSRIPIRRPLIQLRMLHLRLQVILCRRVGNLRGFESGSKGEGVVCGRSEVGGVGVEDEDEVHLSTVNSAHSGRQVRVL